MIFIDGAVQIIGVVIDRLRHNSRHSGQMIQ